MKLYLDDLRAPYFAFDLCRSVKEAKEYVLKNHPNIVNMSLDHDLGLETCDKCLSFPEPCLDDEYEPSCVCQCHTKEAPTGYDFLKWIHENNYWPTYPPMVHSANPIGAARMRNFVMDFGPYDK